MNESRRFADVSRRKGEVGMKKALLVLGACCISLTACAQNASIAGTTTGGSSKDVYPADLGSGWTLKSQHAIVACLVPSNDSSVQELTLNVNGTLYALNGAAVTDPSGTLNGPLSFPPASMFAGGTADVNAYFNAAQALC